MGAYDPNRVEIEVLKGGKVFMSEMRTQFSRGRKARRVAAIAMILALLLGLGAALNASAADGLFKVGVLDNVTTDSSGNLTGATINSDRTAVDGKSIFSTNVSVNLKTDRIFTVTSTDLSRVKRIEMTVSERSSTVAVNFNTNKGWQRAQSSDRYSTKYYYASEAGIDKQTFDNLMSGVDISYSSWSNTSDSSVKLTLVGGADSKSIKDSSRLGLDMNKRKGTTYTEVIRFFNYATANLDPDSVEFHFENDSSDATNENPNPAGRGSVTFDMLVTNVGNASFLRLGYQVKESTQTWDTSTQVLHAISSDTYRYERYSSYWGPSRYPLFDQLGDWYDSSTGTVYNPKSVTITVDGLDPEKEYDIRGVVVTNNDTAAYTKATHVPRVRYVQPVISTLNIGNTAPQQGGTEKEITAAIEFNNQNYDDTYAGPQLKVQLFFTQNRVSKTDSFGSKTDASTWTPVGSASTLTMEQNDDGSYKTGLNFTQRHTLPKADASTCAYKLVVTDINANSTGGYYVTKYSDDTFVLDQNPPTKPSVTAVGLESANLEDGSAAVGGANSNVTLNITGSEDLGSGVKEYSYSMYYLESGKVDSFLRERKLPATSSNETILKEMGKLSGATASKVCEYTPSTSLVLKDEGGKKLSTLSIAKDGFYCVRVTAVDNVGKTSTPTVAIFRVDLTPPNAPVIRLAAQASPTERIESSKTTAAALDKDKFKAYDNRTYSDNTVWVFIRTDIQAGKVVNREKYQYSVNGGLVWRDITSAVNFDNKSAYNLKDGTVKTYNGSFVEEDFKYDSAFQLSSNELSGYQKVMVRTTDGKGNVSLPSAEAEMRTTEIIKAQGTMSHEGIEVAMAMGNTTLENAALIEPELRNAIALKINEKYWGTDHASNAANPMHILYSGSAMHQCAWTDANPNQCTSGANCPYNKDERLYTPSMVNVQGIESANAASDSSFNWVRFDHSQYLTEKWEDGRTFTYPTVAFDSASPLHSTASENIDPTQSTYKTKTGETRYTAMTDYVVYTGQTAAITPEAGVDSVTKLTESTTTNTLAGTQTNQWVTSSNSLLGNDTHTALGRFAIRSGQNYKNASACVRRIYHMVDMTKLNATVNVTGDTFSHTQNSPRGEYSYQTGTLDYGPKDAKMQTIYALGYYRSSSRDWLFLYNGQATKKTIFFSTDDSKIFPHSNDGYGFLFNTTIRQNTDGQWVISGYLFGMGTLQANLSASDYQKFVYYLQDVRLDWFANSRLYSSGTAESVNMDDFFCTLTNNMIDAANGTVTYGTQKVTLIARSPADGKGATTRNYVFVTEGSTAEAYVWNAVGKTPAQLQAQFTKDTVTTNNAETRTDVTAGYTKIKWKQKDASTDYVNENPSLTAAQRNSSKLYVPRPVVDGYSIGDLSKFEDTEDPATEPHTDSNCYGFGPITFARSTGHGCDCDSLVVFSNIVMNVDRAKSLSDVITEPKWGTGKVKYILNISDDSIKDLTDPIMSSNVIWRIQTDQAKLISWGSLINRKTTKDFIDNKIEGNGLYVVSRITGYNDQQVTNTAGVKVMAPGQHTQTLTVADYIADTYYKSYGVDLSAAGTIPEKINAMIAKKGNVYTLENAQKMTFSVSPENYNNGTANTDFPSGRWYISYDATGYGSRASTARFSDALNLKITDPGRYQVYFAPDTKLLGANLKDPTDDMLDPNATNCVFDFIVNEEAEAQPIAILGKDAAKPLEITIEDYSIDPDNNKQTGDAQEFDPVSGQQVTGITKTHWRWELSAPYVDPVTKEQSSIILMKSPTMDCVRANGDNMNPYNGKTIETLTKDVGKLYVEGSYNAASYIQTLKNAGDHSLDYKQTGSTIYYDKVPDGATITIYEQVSEVSTRRVLKDGKIQYAVAAETKSPEKSTNLVNAGEGDQKPIRPASSVTLSKTNLYDTADSSDAITVTRGSFHGQKEDLTLGWEVVDHNKNTKTLTTDDGGKNWKYNGTVVLKEKKAPKFDSVSGRAEGEWTISKDAVGLLAGAPGKEFSLRIIETVTSTVGRTDKWPDGSDPQVSDASGRTIYYSKDDTPPSVQTVTMETGTYDGSKWNYSDYEASNYLDMTKPAGQNGAKEIVATLSGAADNEGKVAGYAYYFYNGSDPKTATYYYMDNSGKLVTAGTGLNGAKAAVNLSTGRGILKKADNSLITEDDAFEVKINENAMYLDNKLRTPTAVLNMVVFAFDNQKNVTTVASGAIGNLTGANETMRTKIENIKLAKFTPMPVAIDAVNTTGETISRIGNDKALTGGVDTMVTEIPVANTNVTVSFTPRQDWFQVTSGGVALETPKRVTDAAKIAELESNGDTTGQYIKYFTDKSGQADLTNKVTVDYRLERKAPGAADYAVVSTETDANYTSTLSINEGGDYRVTARAKNGSGVYSAAQVLTFSVDRERPDEPNVLVYDDASQPYSEGSWVKGAQVVVSGSTDADPKAYYQYSLDNGAHWIERPNLDNFDFTINETGTHYVRVKATDTGGNESEAPMKTIMVDNTPPRVSAPSLSVDFKSNTVFTECVIGISQTAGGEVYSLNSDGTVNENDQDIVVAPGDPASFVIIPAAGKRVLEIKLGDTAYSADDLTPHATIAGGLVLNVPEVTADANLQVTFADAAAPVSYMAAARSASFNAVRTMRAANPVLYAAEDTARAAAVEHVVDINEDLTATLTTPDPGFDVPDGQNLTLNIEVTEGYRVTELVIERAGSAAETVAADQLTKTGANHFSYVVPNVTSDVVVRVNSEKKTPTTITLDVEGNGTVTIDNAVQDGNDTYKTYVDDVIVLTAKPKSSLYKLSSLKVNGAEQVSGTAVDTYNVTVTANAKIEAVFSVAGTNVRDQAEVDVIIGVDANGKTHGTISPRGVVSTVPETGAEKHTITLAAEDDQTILFKPDPTYQPGKIEFIRDATSENPIITAPTPTYDPVTGYYSVTLTTLKATDGNNVVNMNFVGKTHKITAATVAQEPGAADTVGGGTVLINGDAVQEAAVTEGTDATIQITPDTGYRIAGVTLNGRQMGNRRSFTINYVEEDYEIIATFVKRSFGTAKTTHSLTATAVGISDGQEALHSEPYSFKLDDGAWSAFQASTSITYTNLEPNRKYTVTVRARDRRGNISSETTALVAENGQDANAAEKYTLANVPAADAVEAADDTDNVLDKTVKVTIDTMGNPADTEYGVYVSERRDMRGRELAVLQPQNGKEKPDPQDKWSTLDGLGQVTVYQLAPGTTYYLQVVARNHDQLPTEANDQNVLEITLSPTAPPANTLYFEEQSAPGEGIKLNWDDPAGEVEGFQIYRDGALIDEVGKDERSYTDAYSNLRGDGSFVYSYAYRNSAGVGARSTAVSAEYHEKAAAVAAAEASGDATALANAKAELKKLDDLKGEYTNLYKEVMTYPTFPAYFTKVYSMPLGIKTYNGQMVLRIQPESGTAARAQKYVVGLHAYDKDGNLIANGTTYGDSEVTKTWNSTATEKETICTSSSGATVTWDGLNINWDYRVYVKSVMSTGWTTYDSEGNVTNGYQSGTAISPEAALHRKYVVDYQGYGYEYAADSKAKGILAEPSKVAWTDATADEFTKRANDTYTGWNKGNGDGIELSNRSGTTDADNFIKFNKSPQVYIPKNGSDYDVDFLYGDTNTELNAYGNRYLVVEQGGEDMKVQLHVKVYDPDGPADGNLNYTVTGTLGGVVAKTTIEPKNADEPAVGTEANPTDCVLEFDFKNLATGVYDDLTLSVANGSIDVPVDPPVPAGTVKLVVNQSLPTISASNGGGTKKVEEGRNYGAESKLKVASSVSANSQESLRKVRMILMADEYEKAGLNGLFTKVMNGTATSAEIAQIDAIQPPMKSYFQVTETEYQEALTLPEVQADSTLVLTTEPTSGVTYYWAEKEIALTKGWCDFLTRDASGNMTVQKNAADPYGTTYPVLMVAKFGKNESSMNLRFQVMAPPALKVETEQTWQWVKTTHEEIVAYETKAQKAGKTEWTIGDVYQECVDNDALNDPSMTPESLGFNSADPAAQETTTPDGTEYTVFKLWDKKATIQSTEVSSYIQVQTGMYNTIEEAQVVMVPEVSADPSGSDEHAEPPAADSIPTGGTKFIKKATARYQGGATLRDNTRANFRVSNLESGTTYYMWVYYKVQDPESEQMVWYHAQNYIAMTTDSNYKVSTIGFQEANRTYEEASYDATGKTETATLVRLGDYSASGVKVQITAEYFRATQYGEYEVLRDADGAPILDSEGNEQPIQIMPGTPEYQLATEAVTLVDTEREITTGGSQIGVQYHIKNTSSMQGHMIVRLTEKVTGNSGEGINRETTNAETYEIFLLDDESPITSYELGLDDVEGLSLQETGDSHTVSKHYDYQFGGLPYPYGSADATGLSLAIKNAGDGELNEITATLWNADRTSETKEFVFATPPTLTSLASPEEGALAASERSLVKVVPADGLGDGIHEGWLKITANRVKESHEIWVHLYQVVGQATLKGNIYIGEFKPETTSEHVGKAVVKIYSSTTSTGANRGDPLYYAETNDNGYFEIPNILTQQSYCIVVERIGCATYDGVGRGWIWRPAESAAYRFDLRAVAGDINGDAKVDSTDRTELEKYINHSVAEAEAEGMTEMAEAIRRCDLDQNGGVNLIDRMLLWQNLNKGTTTGGITVPLYTQVRPSKIAE